MIAEEELEAIDDSPFLVKLLAVLALGRELQRTKGHTHWWKP